MAEAYAWDNRVRFVVRFMYDLDNNGTLDENDFECLALKYTLTNGKGAYDQEVHNKNRRIMHELWLELAEIADEDKDGQVSVEEFKAAVQSVCMGKSFDQMPQSLKHAINCKFLATDLNGDGKVSLEEFRIDCVNRGSFPTIQEIDDCYNKLLNAEDKANGGITQTRYQELYAEFIGSPDVNVPGAHLFGPLVVY